MKRWIALLTALCLLVSITALAEDVALEDAEPTLTPEELEDQGIRPNTIRLSVGTEHIDDILADLERGFAAVRQLHSPADASAQAQHEGGN